MEVIVQDDDNIQVSLDSSVVLRLPFNWSLEVDVSIKYQLIPRKFAPLDEFSIAGDLLAGGIIPLARVVDFEHLERQFEDRRDFRFYFTITAWESVNLNDLRELRWIEESIEETEAYRRIRIINCLSPRNPENSSLLLRNYPKIIGNLDEEIIWEIGMFAGRRSESWQIEIDVISQPFMIESFKSVVSQALREQSKPVLERIPAFLRRAYPESSDHPLEVVVTVPEIEPKTECTINVTLRDPAGDLYYSTSNPELNRLIRDIHLRLLEHGIPVGPETEVYQRVLAQLLIYRDSCASITGYIDASVAEKSEIKGFHQHLRQRLRHQLDIELVDIVSEPQIGNSRVDLLIEGIPTELKLEDRKTATTDDIVERYEGQAADYIARQGAPFGFLLVLDTVLDREQPTSRVDQDWRLAQVPNVSGASIMVIALVIRIPRPASDHTKLARRRA